MADRNDNPGPKIMIAIVTVKLVDDKEFKEIGNIEMETGRVKLFRIGNNNFPRDIAQIGFHVTSTAKELLKKGETINGGIVIAEKAKP